MKRANIKIKHGLEVEIKESEQGFILDVFRGDDCILTKTFWYDDLNDLEG